MKISLKRIYEPPAQSDGYRVLVDRLWPRGVPKAQAEIDDWAKEFTPSTALRQWFHENRESRWDGFRKRYRAELDGNDGVADFVAELARHEHVTFLIAGKDTKQTHADVLRRYVRARLKEEQ